jgi:two-component system alkaline phosphatase synthesis response regulator PhoP
LRAYFGRLGALVETSHNGQSGVEKALKHTFDMLVLDIQMPGMDGFETIRTLRAKGLTIPAIAYTSIDTRKKEEFEKAGFMQVVSKDAGPTELELHCRNYYKAEHITVN